MMMKRTILGAVALWATAALPVLAGDVALVLSNREYDQGLDSRDALAFDRAARVLRQHGFKVLGGQDWTARTMVEAADTFAQELSEDPEGRAIVIVSGRMVRAGGDTWLLGRDAGTPTAISAGRAGLSLTALLDVLSEYPGRALMLQAPARRSVAPLGDGRAQDRADLPVPQGVALLEGRADQLLAVLDKQVLGGQIPLGQLAKGTDQSLRFRGYLPDHEAFAGADGQPDTESSYWSAVRDIDTRDAYRTYLKRFPDGMYRSQAQRRIETIEQEPFRAAQDAEDALNLSRDDRREIQRQLSLLGFDTRGIDGIFGPGTRKAIAGFQAAQGWEQTGYVDSLLRGALRVQAADRARQQAEEERQRRAEEDRRDRAFWRDTGSRGDEESLRAYLGRFPDGLYADQARAELERIEKERRDQVDRGVRAAWDRARGADTVKAYRAFLEQYPSSPFSRAARDRIEQLEAAQRDAARIERDRTEEASIASIPVTRLLIERTLAAAGFDPGSVDGVFDERSRRAIRQFQRANELPITGYVSQATMVRLMARSTR